MREKLGLVFCHEIVNDLVINKGGKLMLEPYRVLDLTDERGQLAGMMLADLGAEVILVEPPEGSRSRTVGPFVEGREGDPEASCGLVIQPWQEKPHA